MTEVKRKKMKMKMKKKEGEEEEQEKKSERQVNDWEDELPRQVDGEVGDASLIPFDDGSKLSKTRTEA